MSGLHQSDELTTLRAEFTAFRIEVEARERARRRRSLRHQRLLPALIVTLLVALLPFSLLAAGFTDLPNPDQGHNADINAIAAAGVTKGCNPPVNDAYCPFDTVTRQDMASFLARLGGLGDNPPVANAKTLGGHVPSDFGRASFGWSDQPALSLPATFGPLARVTLTAPHSGYVIVLATVTLASQSATPVDVDLQTREENNSWIGDARFMRIGTAAGAAGQATVTLHDIYGIPPSGGSLSFVFEAAGQPVSAFFPKITAIYVPFDGTGSNTLTQP